MSDTAVISLVTGAVTITTTVIAFLTLWVKLKYGVERTEDLARKTDVVENKIDDNTKITRAGTAAAVANAKDAAMVAAEAKAATAIMAADLSRKLNGGVDDAMASALAPLQRKLEEHAATDERNMAEVKTALQELNKRIR